MAGGAQGGGAKPAQGQGFNPQAAQQFQQALQNYRQGAMEMPSQMPGANAAAPGGGMPQFGMAKPMPMPAPGMGGGPQIQPPQGGQGWVSGGPYIPPGGMGTPQPAQQLNPFANVPQQANPNLAAYMNAPGTGQMLQGTAPQPSQQLNPFANVPQQPQGPISVGAYQPQGQPQVTQPLPQAQPQPMPRPMPRPMPMPQVQGNPNAMPLQRPQPQARGQMLRGRR